MDLSTEFMKVLKERDLQKSRGKKVASLEDLFDREGDYLMKDFPLVVSQLNVEGVDYAR
jgi:hypothetical protein